MADSNPQHTVPDERRNSPSSVDDKHLEEGVYGEPDNGK